MAHRQLFDRSSFPFVVAKEGRSLLRPLRGADLTNPDVAEPNWIAMILQSNGKSIRMLGVLGRASIGGVTLQLEVIENDDSVVNAGHVGW